MTIDLRVLLGNTAMPHPGAPAAPPPAPRGPDKRKRGPSTRTLGVLGLMPPEFTAWEWMACAGCGYASAAQVLGRLTALGLVESTGARRPVRRGFGGIVYRRRSR